MKGFRDSNFGFDLASKRQNLAFFGINLGSLWLYLGSFWVRFFTIVNNDGHSLGSFFQKNFFSETRSSKLEDRSENPRSRSPAVGQAARPFQ